MSLDVLAQCVALGTTLMTLLGLAFVLSALLAARAFRKKMVRPLPAPAVWPAVSVMKPVKGWDPGRYAAFASCCAQDYAGAFEVVIGLSDPDDAALLADIARLQEEFSSVTVRAVPCPERLGPSGKVSTLLQMMPHAGGQVLVINDADIVVGPGYLTAVATELNQPNVGLVTALFRADAAMTIPSRLEALGLAGEAMGSVLVAERVDRGMRFAMGSTLAMRRTTLENIGGLEPLLPKLADDYEMGQRVCQAGETVSLLREPVATSVPAYDFREFWQHQIRWSRTVRSARPVQYLGIVFTFALPWAMVNLIATAFALPALTLLSFALLLRVAVALNVGVGVLRDGQVLRDLWLLPLRDCLSMALWAWTFASDRVVWRGERFRVDKGELVRL